MAEIIQQILSIGHENGLLVAGLTIACALMLLHGTDSKPLALLFLPIAAFCASAGIYITRESGLYFSAYQPSNIILSGLIGVIVSLVLVLLAARLTSSLMNSLRKRQSSQLGSSHD